MNCFRLFRALAVCALLLLSACDQQRLMQKFASAEDQANARKVIDSLRAGNLEAIEKAADSSISSPNLHDTLVKMAALIPKQEPISVTLVGAQTMHGPNTRLKILRSNTISQENGLC